MPSGTGKETSTSESWLLDARKLTRGLRLGAALDAVARLAQSQCGAQIWFVQILGRRWAYVAGCRSPGPVAGPLQRASLGGGIGMVSDDWGTLSGCGRARLLGLLHEIVLHRQAP